MICHYRYDAGVEIIPGAISQVGECLAYPNGAFLSYSGEMFYFCLVHKKEVHNSLLMNLTENHFPLGEMSVNDAIAMEVMNS
jgi:sugar lactone lactonase YvrE